MIPYDIDPSLHSHEPARDVLDDGFSRPVASTHPVEPAAAPVDEHPTVPVVVGEPGPELTLPETAHVEPEPVEHGQEDEQHPEGAV